MQGTVFILTALVACAFGSEEAFPDWSARVVGGTNAAQGEFPFIVSLRRTTNSHFCGGSIISNNYILTAAHCVTGTSASAVVVVAGTNTLNSGGTSYRVSRIVIHSAYSAAASWRNDIALLRVSTPISYTSLIQPVTLPRQGENPAVGASAVASGWGYTRHPGTSLPNNLQKVTLQIVSNQQCQSSHSGTIYTSSICASGGAGRGVCNGDSGGPLVSGGRQVGIVSWGRPCAVGVPDVYARVPEFYNWIVQNAV